MVLQLVGSLPISCQQGLALLAQLSDALSIATLLFANKHLVGQAIPLRRLSCISLGNLWSHSVGVPRPTEATIKDDQDNGAAEG